MAIDPRFSHEDPGFVEWRRRTEQADEELHSLVPDLDTVVTGIANWIQEIVFRSVEPIEHQDLRVFMSSLGFEDKPTWWVFRSAPNFPDELLLPLATAWKPKSQRADLRIANLFGRAISEAQLGESHLFSYQTAVWELLRALPENARRVYEEQFVAELKRSEGTRARLITDLQEDIQNLNQNPDRAVMTREIGLLNTEIERWESEPALVRTWKYWNSYSLFHGPCGFGLRMLLQADTPAWCDCIDLLKIPHALSDAFAAEVLTHDPEKLLEVLSSAPAVFDQSSTVVSEVAGFTLEVCLSFGSELFSSVSRYHPDQLEHLENKELPEWYARVVDVLLGRPDGVELGIRWLMALFEKIRLQGLREESGSQPQPFDSASLVRNLLGQELGEQIDGGDVVRVMPIHLEEHDLPACIRVHGKEDALVPLLVSIWMESGRDEVCSDRVRDYLRRFRVVCETAADDVLDTERLSQREQWGYESQLGWMLYQQDDPVQKWRELWEALLDQRRIGARKSIYYVKHWQPSTLVLWAGVGLIQRYMTDKRSDEAIALWRELEQEIRWQWITTPQGHDGPFWRRHLAHLFAFWPSLSAEASGQLAEEFCESLANYREDPQMFSTIVSALDFNGFDVPRMKDDCSALIFDVLERLQVELAWQASIREKQRSSKEMLEHLFSIVEKLEPIAHPAVHNPESPDLPRSF